MSTPPTLWMGHGTIYRTFTFTRFTDICLTYLLKTHGNINTWTITNSSKLTVNIYKIRNHF